MTTIRAEISGLRTAEKEEEIKRAGKNVPTTEKAIKPQLSRTDVLKKGTQTETKPKTEKAKIKVLINRQERTINRPVKIVMRAGIKISGAVHIAAETESGNNCTLTASLYGVIMI